MAVSVYLVLKMTVSLEYKPYRNVLYFMFTIMAGIHIPSYHNLALDNDA